MNAEGTSSGGWEAEFVLANLWVAEWLPLVAVTIYYFHVFPQPYPKIHLRLYRNTDSFFKFSFLGCGLVNYLNYNNSPLYFFDITDSLYSKYFGCSDFNFAFMNH